MAFNTYITAPQQSVFDLTIQIYGSLDYLAQLMTDNNLNVQSYIKPGTPILYDSNFTINPNIIISGNGLYGTP